MINYNLHNLDLLERKMILKRALYTEPFIHFFEFNLTAKANRQKEFAGTSKIDKDYYVTELRSNLSDVEEITGTSFKLSVYTAQTNKSLFQYYKSFLLPSSFQTTEARFNTAYNAQKYDDRQREMMPYKIQRGNSLVVNLNNDIAIGESAKARVAAIGYYVNKNAYFSDDTQRGINESLALEPKIEAWLPNSDYAQLAETINGGISQNYNFQNDRFARIVVGFQIKDTTNEFNFLTDAKIRIFDTKRNIRWNNEPIPLEFLAPRFPACRDTNIYYLPIEYLWQPFSSLRMEIITGTANKSYQLSMITRLV